LNQLIFFIFIVNVLFWLFFIFFRKNRIIRSFVKNLNSHFLDDICDCVLIVNQKGRILKKNRQAKLFFTQFIDEDPKYTEKIFNNYHFYKNYKNKRFTLKDSSKEILLTQEPLFFLGKREYKIIFFKNTEKVFDNQILLLENEDRIKDFLQDAFFSEESFKAVFDEAAIAIAMTDLEGKIILANQSFASILQEKRHELQFKNFKDFVFSGDRLIDENFYKELLSGKKKTYQIEKRLVNHSGKIVWCHITYSLIFNLKNQPESIILMIEDATQKKENEVLLWENEKLYRSLFQNLFYGVAYLEILKDEKGIPNDMRMIDVNQAFENLTYTMRQDVIGKTLKEVLEFDPKKDEIIRFWLQIYENINELKKEIEFEYFAEITQKNYYCSAFIPQENRMFILISDVSETRKKEKELRSLSSLIEQSFNTVIITNIKWKIEYINPAFEKITGFSRRDFIGDYFYHFPSDKNINIDYEEAVNFLMKGKTWSAEVRSLKKDGTFFWEMMYVSPLLDADEKMIQFSIIKNDITYKKLAEESLRQSEEKLKKVFDTAPIGIAILDKLGQILKTNHFFNRMLGYRSEDLKNKYVSDITHPEDYQKEVELIRSLKKDNLVFQFEKRYLKKDGTYLSTLIYANKIIYSESLKPLYIAFIQDLTEKKKLSIRLTNYEEKFKEFSELFPMVVFEIDFQNNKVNYVNMNGQEFFGYSFDDIVKIKPILFVSEEDRRKIRKKILKMCKEHFAFSEEVKMMRKNKETANMLLQAVPIYKERKIQGMRGTLIDISIQKEKQSKLENRQIILTEKMIHREKELSKTSELLNRYENLLKGIIEAVADLLSPDIHRDKITSALKKLAFAAQVDRVYIFENFFENDELFMTQRFEWCQEGIEPQINNPLLKKLSYREGFSRWIDLFQKNQSIQGIVKDFPEEERKTLSEQGISSILAVPIYIDNKIWGFIGFDDCKNERLWQPEEEQMLITAAYAFGSAVNKNRIEQELLFSYQKLEDKVANRTEDLYEMNLLLKKKTDELNHSNQELTEYASIISHDLKQPLLTISNYLQILKKKMTSKLDPKTSEYIQIMIRSSIRMQNMIEDLLKYSKLDFKLKEFKLLDIGSIIEEVVMGMKPFILDKKALIHYEKMPVIYADRTQMIQLFQNLINNGIKFKKENTDPRIEIEAKKLNHEWLFTVKDNGIGIHEKYLHDIFQIFNRGDKKDDLEGTGVGLAVCKKIVLSHKGKIWVESIYGEGTIFHFTLSDQLGDENENTFS